MPLAPSYSFELQQRSVTLRHISGWSKEFQAVIGPSERHMLSLTELQCDEWRVPPKKRKVKVK